MQLLFADGVLYYQTSMAPQFVLSGIPTIQVGHVVYSDILVRQGLCHVATGADRLWNGLRNTEMLPSANEIEAELGIDPEWASNLEQVLLERTRG